MEVTRSCNHHCLYCYTAWGAPELAYPTGDGKQLSLDEIKGIVARLQEECPVQNITLSGGEPFTRPDLPEIVRAIQSRGISTTIITNGTLLTQERIDRTKEGSLFEITLLSYDPAVHDRLAGRQGAWQAAFDALIRLRQAGGNVVTVFIATPLNYQHLEHTAELAMVLGAKGLMYNRLNLARASMPNAASLLPTPAMIRENLQTLEALAVEYGLPISVSVVIEPCVVPIEQYPHLHFGFCPLGGEDSYFTIDPSGNLRICNHSPVILGNLLHDRFSEIYYNHPYLKKFREELPQECADCPPERKDLCRGGCKAAGEQCYGALDRVDPFVRINRA